MIITPERIDTMDMLELNLLVAYHVMQWTRTDNGDPYTNKPLNLFLVKKEDRYVYRGIPYRVDLPEDYAVIFMYTWRTWNPTMDLVDAWEVVEKLESDGIYWKAENSLPKNAPKAYIWDFERLGKPEDHGVAFTLPLAICRAALLTTLDR